MHDARRGWQRSGPLHHRVARGRGTAQFGLSVGLNDCSTPNGLGIVASANVASSTADPNPAANNTATAAIQVSNPPPDLTVVGAPLLLSPPQHQYVTIPVTSLVTAATDTCDGNLVDAVVITQVTSDEPDMGNGDGNTANDIVIAANCRSVQLRAERAGPLNGRVYTVTLRVRDAAGNSTTKTVKVLVPFDVVGTTAVDDGPALTVASACN